MDKLQDACFWAAELHRDQFRDGETPLPYITHPMEVLTNLRYVGEVDDIEMLCAAALHDSMEETSVTHDQIKKRLGKRVADLVKALTRYEPGPKELEGLSEDEIWELHSQFLLDEIAKMTPEVQVIKLADRLANVRGALVSKKGKKLKRYIAQSNQILKIVPKKVNPGLWKAIEKELDRD